jgi:CHRD domain
MKPPMLLSALAILVVCAMVWPAIAQPPAARNFIAHLSGDEEVPPVETLAEGQAIFHLNKDDTALNYQLIVANIENVSVAHIHCGAAGVNGPVVVFLFGPATPAVTVNGILAKDIITDDGIIERPDSAQCPGGVADFDELLAKMRSGDAYVNVHTTAHLSGEMRGQIDVAGP